jgi:hypothetical protein
MSTLQAIVGVSLIGVLAVVAILALRPHDDNTQLIVTVIGFLAPTLVALLDTIRTQRVNDSVQRLHDRLDEPPKAE